MGRITRQRHAQRITAAWRKGVESILETGRALIAAKADLAHGQFTAMVERELPFGPRTAERLMAIAANAILSNPTHVSVLPPSWGTLYELAQLPDELLLRHIEGGEINAGMERVDAIALRPVREAVESAVEPVAPMHMPAEAARWLNRTHVGDCRELLPQMARDGVRVQMCCCSPPYFKLRDYGVAGQIGLEDTPDEYVKQLVAVFRAVRDMLADDGTVWLNLGDSYADKELLGIPWRVALALQADGWTLRSEIIWHRHNVMPESVTDRPTKVHETVFLLAKSGTGYYYNAAAIAEQAKFWNKDPRSGQGSIRYTAGKRRGAPGTGQEAFVSINRTRNARSVWEINTQRRGSGAHPAAFPEELVKRCVLAGSARGGVVLDPFMGSGTVAKVAADLGRQFVGCETNGQYVQSHRVARHRRQHAPAPTAPAAAPA